ncbi:hypothetical protein I7I50_03529 [Histoplasma capsulatum G186AR]|uniref:Uncharacterized protein n=1 Tax=Ajellomyces capsulatus TaxID=5037 RepID=A0A8H7YP47_AJECA|nr:hypothetical protein I7I52_04436 [Histoplasma capsulatum]QSS74655.1 hypothetical protein I7I50_03529 [Histoplasma capsulatum G186AR]
MTRSCATVMPCESNHHHFDKNPSRDSNFSSGKTVLISTPCAVLSSHQKSPSRIRRGVVHMVVGSRIQDSRNSNLSYIPLTFSQIPISSLQVRFSPDIVN